MKCKNCGASDGEVRQCANCKHHWIEDKEPGDILGAMPELAGCITPDDATCPRWSEK